MGKTMPPPFHAELATPIGNVTHRLPLRERTLSEETVAEGFCRPKWAGDLIGVKPMYIRLASLSDSQRSHAECVRKTDQSSATAASFPPAFLASYSFAVSITATP